MNEQNLNDMEFLYCEGCEWLQGALLLLKENDNKYSQVASSMMCFSIELFYKSLWIYSGIDIQNKHSLIFLFKQIPKELQNQIKENTDFQSEEDIVEAYTKNNISGFKSYEEALELISNDFINQRYIYERLKEKHFVLSRITAIESIAKGCKKTVGNIVKIEN